MTTILFGVKLFGVKNCLWPNKIWGQKIVGVKTNLGSKFVCGLKNVGGRKNLGDVGIFPLMPMGGRVEGQACADPGARTPIGVSGNLQMIYLQYRL